MSQRDSNNRRIVQSKSDWWPVDTSDQFAGLNIALNLLAPSDHLDPEGKSDIHDFCS